MADVVTVSDVQARMLRTLSSDEQALAATLLSDACVMIYTIAPDAPDNAVKVVACRMVIRALGDGSSAAGVPVGATQASMSALGYTQSWTVSGGAAGELYVSKSDRRLLGLGDAIGSRSPTEDLVCAGSQST